MFFTHTHSNYMCAGDRVKYKKKFTLMIDIMLLNEYLMHAASMPSSLPKLLPFFEGGLKLSPASSTSNRISQTS